MRLKEFVLECIDSHCGGIEYGVLRDAVSATGEYSLLSLNTIIYRLIKERRIEKTPDSIIRMIQPISEKFSLSLDEETVELYRKLKSKFPFSAISMWNTGAIGSLLHDVPDSDILVVSVDKDIMPTFMDVLENVTDRLAFYDTDKFNVERFSSVRNIIVVSQLVSQAPLQEKDGITYPKIEKILVDILCENSLSFLSGSQAYDIYTEAFNRYDINRKALLRYAGRRSRTEEVKTILNEIDR